MARKRSAPPASEEPSRTWTPQDDVFLEAIRENPTDDMPRMNYADWLTKQGDPRGEFIRLQDQLAKTPHRQRGRRVLRLQCEKMLRLHQRRWTQSLHGATHGGFPRGFVVSATLDLVAFRQSAGQMLRPHPILSLTMKQHPEATAEDARLLASCPHLTGVRFLGLELLGVGLIRIVLDSPYWAHLAELEVAHPYGGCQADPLVDELSESAALAGLKRFNLKQNLLTAESLRRLVNSPRCRLEKLDLSGLERWHRVAGGPGFANISADLSGYSYHPAVPGEAAEIIARSPAAVSLRELDLRYCGLDSEGIRALLESPYLQDLKQLRLEEPTSDVLSRHGDALRQRFGDRLVMRE